MSNGVPPPKGLAPPPWTRGPPPAGQAILFSFSESPDIVLKTPDAKLIRVEGNFVRRRFPWQCRDEVTMPFELGPTHSRKKRPSVVSFLPATGTRR
jgi:hypothetical protein